MLAPIVRAAAEQAPGTEFTMLSQQRFADLFADMPANVLFHGVELKKQSLPEIIRGLGAFEYVADMHDVIRSVVIRNALRLKGAKVVRIDKGRRDKWLLTHGRIHEPLKRTTERYWEVFEKIGITKNSRKTHEIPTKMVRSGIGIAPFAAHEGKIYPIERMERVVELLSRKGERIVLFGGGKREQEILDRWAERYANVESLAGRKSMREELEIMRGLRIMLTMDSGNMHLASLVGTRVISIWGATHPYAGFLGYGQSEQDCIQRDLPCRPCSIYGNKPCHLGDYRCLDFSAEEIAERVWKACNEKQQA
jgi:ADP-heptose:LPS heptosyltransferase